MTKESNETKHITDKTSTNELDIPQDKETRFALELFKDPTNVRQAAIRAGYSKSTATQGYIYQKLQSPKFQQKLKETAISNDFKHLALVYDLEHRALKQAILEAIEDPKSSIRNIAKLKHISKQKKQITGTLRDDAQAKPPVTINVKELRLTMSDFIPDHAQKVIPDENDY
jgi:phage terminase small subunit